MSDRKENINFNLYEDIKKRTNGEIYLGVVGPVRTGKSTFVKRFMDLCVIPEIADANEKQRTIDELPQSSAGSTIMTTEPKFIPGESAAICMADDIKIKVRAIDCVGFMVDGAMGAEENGKERMVNTPWSKDPVPFSMAAQIGTEKVIEEHSTIGIVITTDGSFTGIERDNYVNAEQMAIDKLKKISKPFVVILNCVKPYAKESVQFLRSFSEKYGVIKMATPELMKILLSYDWPGNVRELRNILEKLVIMTDPKNIYLSEMIESVGFPIKEVPADFVLPIEDLTYYEKLYQAYPEQFSLKNCLENFESSLIKSVLDHTHNTYKAAEILKVDQSSISRKINKYHISYNKK